MPGLGPRAGRAIVRTGCVTCKARRVKCDERKPTCLRCEKAGKICQGYKNPAKVVQPTPETRALVPRDAAGGSESSLGRMYSSADLPSRPLSLAKSLFENELQQRYFNIFCNKTAEQLAGCMGFLSWWDTVIPQACERESSIRHAVIALGALDFTADSGKLMQSSTKDRQQVSEHHAFALQEYDQAIKLLRDQSSKGDVDLRTAMIFCICCVCFEAFHGDINSAIAQVFAGINLLLEALHKCGGDTGDSLGGGISSIPWIERELILTMRLLGCPGNCFFDPRPLVCCDQHNSIFQEAIEDMPSVFLDYKQARLYQQTLTKRSSHFLHELVQFEFRPDFYRHQTVGWRIIDPIIHPLSYVPPSELEQHKKNVLDFTRWADAFAPLENYSHTENPDFILAATTKLHYLVSKILTEHALSLSQTSYDESLASFAEIITLTMALLSHPNHYTKKGCFTFHSQYIMPLFICGLKCRNRSIRRQAVSLLLSSSRREGLWDSTSIAKLLEWIIRIEEEGADRNGYIPESARTRAVSADLDLPNQKARVSCLVPRYDGEFEFREAIITWSAYIEH